jgi:ppGpp synthetase/RelA/SpoT-type nucleotidyltranferase
MSSARSDERPRFASYEQWLIRSHRIPSFSKLRNHYASLTREAADSIRASDFWTSVLDGLKDVDAKYLVASKYPLIATYSPELLIKPWDSFLDKTYRRNIVNNPHFPDPPENGWLLPDNWYTSIHDVIRTTIIVRYLDGIPLLINFLREKANFANNQFESELEARAEGYYGAHCSCALECEISTLEWHRIFQQFSLEIQVTTSMKDVIKNLLHSYYESRRASGSTVTLQDLSWNYKSEDFVTGYLGHILHYVEGMILDVRDRKRG